MHQACTDTSRLFFLPRRPVEGPPPETVILEGEPCDILALSDPPGAGPSGASPGAARRRQTTDDTDFVDPETGELFDLRSWARRYGQSFLIVQALRARQPGVLVGKVADGLRHHIRCPNEAEHTQAGEDVATFVCDAGSSSDTKGFVIHCRHAHCDGRDRLFLLRRMLEQGWLTVADLTDPKFLAVDVPARRLIRFIGGEIPKVVDEAEDALLTADLGIYQRGSVLVPPGRVLVTVPAVRTFRHSAPSRLATTPWPRP